MAIHLLSSLAVSTSTSWHKYVKRVVSELHFMALKININTWRWMCFQINPEEYLHLFSGGQDEGTPEKPWPWLMFHDVNSTTVGKSLISEPYLHKSPHDDRWMICLYGVCVLRQLITTGLQCKEGWQSIWGPMCCFREKGASLRGEFCQLGRGWPSKFDPNVPLKRTKLVTVSTSLFRDFHMKDGGLKGVGVRREKKIMTQNLTPFEKRRKYMYLNVFTILFFDAKASLELS